MVWMPHLKPVGTNMVMGERVRRAAPTISGFHTCSFHDFLDALEEGGTEALTEEKRTHAVLLTLFDVTKSSCKVYVGRF